MGSALPTLSPERQTRDRPPSQWRPRLALVLFLVSTLLMVDALVLEVQIVEGVIGMVPNLQALVDRGVRFAQAL